jgi:hypothetical protein
MMTVDKLLLKITAYTTPSVEEYMSTKDARLAHSLTSAVKSPNFITENQASLLVKLLTNYSKHISVIDEETEKLLLTPVWSKSFRVVEQVRRIYLHTAETGENVIFVEFTFSSIIRKILNNLSKNIQGGVHTVSNKLASIELTEKNIVILLDGLKSQKFEIDQKIQDFYKIVKKWNLKEECSQLFFGEKLYPLIQTSLAAEFDNTADNVDNLILDRSLRYQFFVKKTEKISENLEDLIVNRTHSKLWIDSNTHSLENLFASLKSLNRLPTLIVFDSWASENCLANLKNLTNSLEKNEIFDHVGLYFRLPNEASGKEFNTLIGEKKYNSKLDNSTIIAGVQTGKLPKFFLKDCSWEPRSVIVLGNNLRHSKTAVYSNRCDLIISYSDKPSIFETSTGWATSTWAL